VKANAFKCDNCGKLTQDVFAGIPDASKDFCQACYEPLKAAIKASGETRQAAEPLPEIVEMLARIRDLEAAVYKAEWPGNGCDCKTSSKEGYRFQCSKCRPAYDGLMF